MPPDPPLTDDRDEPLQLLPLCDRQVLFEPEPEDQLLPLPPELMLLFQLHVPLRLLQRHWPVFQSIGQPCCAQLEY